MVAALNDVTPCRAEQPQSETHRASRCTEDSRGVGAGAVDVDVSGMDWRKYHRIGRQYGARSKSIALVRRHLWLASEGFPRSPSDPDTQELPTALYHRLVDSLAYAA